MRTCAVSGGYALDRPEEEKEKEEKKSEVLKEQSLLYGIVCLF